MIILGVRIQDRSMLRGLGRKYGAAQKAALRETAEFWHARVFAKHFGAANRSEYRLAPRGPVYTRFIKPEKGQGVGRFRDEVLTGRSQRFMQAFFRISGTAKRVTVRMFPPSYFTRPFIGSFVDPRTGKTKRVTRQPDKPDEVTRFSLTDRRILHDHAADRLLGHLKRAREHTTVTIQG